MTLDAILTASGAFELGQLQQVLLITQRLLLRTLRQFLEALTERGQLQLP